MRRTLAAIAALLVGLCVASTAEARTRASSTSLTGVVEPLAQKAREIIGNCPGTKIVSTIRSWGVTPNHRQGKAVDIAVTKGRSWSRNKSDYGCVYTHLAGWPGGYSGDPQRVAHVHISYSKQHEWGNHGFAHGGSHRVAKRGHGRVASRAVPAGTDVASASPYPN